jgi:hypothetical protein
MDLKIVTHADDIKFHGSFKKIKKLIRSNSCHFKRFPVPGTMIKPVLIDGLKDDPPRIPSGKTDFHHHSPVINGVGVVPGILMKYCCLIHAGSFFYQENINGYCLKKL